jgi:ferredoxin--NADP+ reductase
VLDAHGGRPVPGLYTSGWIKRGPSGVIGTNKPDSVETVASMLEDAAAGGCWHPPAPDPASAEAFVRARQPHVVTYAEWRRLDALEIANGQAIGRPRLKFSRVSDMLAALGRR